MCRHCEHFIQDKTAPRGNDYKCMNIKEQLALNTTPSHSQVKWFVALQLFTLFYSAKYYIWSVAASLNCNVNKDMTNVSAI